MSIELVMPCNHLILCLPLLLLPSIFPSIRVFSMSQFIASGGQNIRVSASASVLPMNTQDWSPLGWTGWISLQFKGLLRVFSNTTVQKINSSALSFLYRCTNTFYQRIKRVRHAGLIPGLGRSLGGGNSYPLQYSCLENPMDRKAWWDLVHRVSKSQTQLKWLNMSLGVEICLDKSEKSLILKDWY